MKMPDILDMLKAGVHFGHQTSRWHPKMKEYIFTQRAGVHVIDLEKTRAMLQDTLEVVKQMSAQGKQILFISTKPQAKDIVKKAAQDCDMPYLVDRWIGGLLTNFPEIKKLIKKYLSLKGQQKSGELEKYTKKERLEISKKLEKMEVSLVGLSSLDKMPDALFIPAVQKEKTAVTEANRMGVLIIGVCDTNADPNKASFIIPANDDAIKSIEMISNLISEAVKEGKKEWEKNKLVTDQKEDKFKKSVIGKTSDEKKEEIKKKLDKKMGV